jgi:DNA-binding transcriptional MerR regulator
MYKDDKMILDIKKRMTITEVAQHVGVSSKTIARWEKLGKTRKAKRDWRGWRVYDENDLEQIKNFFETVFEVE